MARDDERTSETHRGAVRALALGAARALWSLVDLRLPAVVLAIACVGAALPGSQSDVPASAPTDTVEPPLKPRDWLPRDESLRFMVEVTVGPVRGLDVGSVTLACLQTPARKVTAEDAAASLVEQPEVIATIDGTARAVYLGRKVNHAIAVRWFEGNRPRIDYREALRGSRCSTRELRIGEFDGLWKLEYRKDRHCKGCKDSAHYVDGFMPWSKPSHCDDCDEPSHRVWRERTYLEVPSGSIDIVSALYFARGFVRSKADSTTIGLVNHDEVWNVHLTRKDVRKVETPAGDFECVRVLIGPELAAGNGPGTAANPRFEALFGLHGDISVWVERERGFPVMIEGTAPIGPFDVHVKASLTARRGG